MNFYITHLKTCNIIEANYREKNYFVYKFEKEKIIPIIPFKDVIEINKIAKIPKVFYINAKSKNYKDFSIINYGSSNVKLENNYLIDDIPSLFGLIPPDCKIIDYGDLFKKDKIIYNITPFSLKNMTRKNKNYKSQTNFH